MRISSPSSDRVLSIYLALNQYPILKQRIRARMRRALFQWGVIRPDQFEVEVRKRAIESQTREGLNDPYAEESFETWELRLFRVRESLTDFYFAHNFLYEDFEMIVKEIVGERGSVPDIITFNPELAPQDMLFEQAELIENQSSQMPDQNQGLMARLQEIKAVLIRTMISDQLTYLNIARKWFTISDLKEIKQRTIGYGKIGGKSAGMILAYRILSEAAPPEIKAAIRLPVSYFLASDMFYTFMATNELMHWADQKYKNEAQIRAEFETIKADFVKGTFPDDIVDKLKEILAEAGKQPLIVRSSSLLEDNLGMSFAGKYDSFFCPNQGTPEENLKALVEGIALVYASCFNPDAILYRNHKGLIEYDERIAVLIQHVQGERYGDFFMPQASGVGFSRNLYRWSPQISVGVGNARRGTAGRRLSASGSFEPPLVAPGGRDENAQALFAALCGCDRPESQSGDHPARRKNAQSALPTYPLHCPG
jgi:hypothetical protein